MRPRKWYRWSYLQNRNRDTDVENKCMDIERGRGGGVNWKTGMPPGSSIHGIFQARVLEWGAIAFFSFSLLVYNLWFLWRLSEMASYSWSRQLILDKSLWWLNSWEKKQDWVTQFDYNHWITIVGLLHSLQAEKKFIRSGKSICFPKKCHPWSLK